jgi:hypothetical protein
MQDHQVLGHVVGNKAFIKPEMERQIAMWELIILGQF